MRIIVSVGLMVLLAAGCSAVKSSDNGQSAASRPLVIDVRSAEEFDAGHIEGAINIPYDSIRSGIAHYANDKSREIIVYCRSGRRSAIAFKTLDEMGYTQIEDAGGMEAYEERPGQ